MFQLKIETANACFEDYGEPNEVAKVLEYVADRLRNGDFDRLSPGCFQTVHDRNGNDIGRAKLTREHACLIPGRMLAR